MVPLDRRREWYRYHHLLRELLQAELQRREPDLVQDLHFRAAAWYEANAMPEAAIEHAQAAGDYDRVARLVLELQQPVWASGRVETVLRWMEWLRDVTAAEHFGAIAVHGSLIFALLGQPSEAERWAAAAERRPPAGILPDGSTMEGTLAYLRAILCRNGIDEMRRDAQLAWDGLSPASPYRATMLYTEGISYLLQGDPTGLTRSWPVRSTTRPAPAPCPWPPSSWPSSATWPPSAATGPRSRRSRSARSRSWRPGVSTTTGPAPSSTPGRPGPRCTAGTSPRPGTTSGAPPGCGRCSPTRCRSCRSRHCSRWRAAYIALADPGGAAAVLAQVHDILQQRPDLGVLPGQASELQSRLATIKAGAAGASSLTAAELRLLPLLSTHLSFREIGERLFVSAHTVKDPGVFRVPEARGLVPQRGGGPRTRARAWTRSS